MIRSNVPEATSYLRVDSVFTTQKYIANWESKKRLCANNDYNRTDCFEETTFQFNVDVTDNAVFTCGHETVESSGHNVESTGHTVEVIDGGIRFSTHDSCN